MLRGHPRCSTSSRRTVRAATFFLVGEQVEREPGLAREIAAAGHAIGIHGYRHTLLLRRSPRAIREGPQRAREVIGGATGTEPLVYRPPYGVFSGPALLPRPPARLATAALVSLGTRLGREHHAVRDRCARDASTRER